MKTTFAAAILVLVIAQSAPAELSALIIPSMLEEPLPQEVIPVLEEAGYVASVASIQSDEVSQWQALIAAPDAAPDLLVMVDGARLPVGLRDPLDQYLKAGGDIVAFQAPLWQEPRLFHEGHWLTRDAYTEANAGVLLQRVLFDFGQATLSDWTRSADVPDHASTQEVVATGRGASAALHVQFDMLTSWETFISPMLESPFPEGHSITAFYAKGGPKTPEMMMEWRERDQSRWIATIPLSESWQLYTLRPEDFRFWESNETRRGSTFQPANAEQLSIGLAHSHARVTGGPYEYWMSDIGTAPVTPVHERLLTALAPPAWELLSPGYKFSDVSVEPGTRAMYSRPGAGGFDKGRDWRWQALETVKSASGHSAATAAMLVHADGPYKGGVWVSSTKAFSEQLLRTVAGPLAQGVFIVDGGAEYYTCFEDQQVRVGMTVVNLSNQMQAGLLGRVVLREGDENAHMREWPIDLPPGGRLVVEEEIAVDTWPEGGYEVQAALVDNDAVIDSATHELQVWQPKRNPQYMTVKDGDFYLGDERWKPNGVNYMPSSGIAVEDQAYFEYWIDKAAYDPAIIQADLDNIKRVGMNSIAIFIYHRSLAAQNLLDLLRRCDAMDIKVNLSLRPGTPLEFEWGMMRELLEYYRIAEHDCVCALDLAWEPMFGNHDERKRWDGAWRDWVIERYGSIENAERDWQFEAPREEGQLSNPLNHMTVDDGAWRIYVAAYRRFLDTLLYEYYSRARDLVKSVDPNHLVSYRMTEAGNPTFKWGERIPHDWPYLAAAVDILEPEAYGRIGDWEKVKPGWFQFEYARWAAPHLPMMWAEAGVHVWEQGRMEATPERLEFQGQYYEDLYRMFTNSGADGIFFWWYPGGYRTNERSDYGIFNADGSDRPSTLQIMEKGPAMLAAPTPGPIDTWIEIDRDAHPAGVAGIYDATQETFWTAIEDGKVPGFRTAGTGTTSVDCPLIAVGNTPYNGNNPPKYLDAFFDRIEVLNADGEWGRLTSDAAAPLGPDGQVHLRLTITNLGEAAWLPGKEDGGVVLIAEENDFNTPLAETVPRFGRITHDVTIPPTGGTIHLRLEAKNRAHFGPRLALILPSP
jgi:hypothetical protein